jgi:PAS domain S-box-containing protein
LACGTTHVFDVLTLWFPFYWADGVVKLVTAALSVTTAVMLWLLLPRALSIPSQRQLQALNARLSEEISERRAVEARLRSIYAHTPAPLCVADVNGRIVKVSNQWLELLGLSREEVIGQPLHDYYAGADRDAVEHTWTALWDEGEMRAVEQTLQHKDGSVRQVLTSAVIDREATGGGLAVSAMADVTGRRATEEALRVSEAHLRQAQKMEAVGHLTGGIAHDFNNMLTAITCVMELLQKRLPEDDRSRTLVTSVLDVSHRAAKLTGQLLAFSRRQRLVPMVLDPAEVIDGLGGLLTRPLGEQVQLQVLPPATHWLALADRNQLEAALLNLVLNARAAINEGGTITIAVTGVAADDPTLTQAPEAGEDPLMSRDYVAITVADNGSGMSEDVRQKAFEPFFTTKPVGQGSGLGLSQTYGFARQSGGTVRIDSAPGTGTRVTIFLPRAVEHAAVETRVPDLRRPEISIRNGQTVLVVEDEDTLRGVVVAALTEFGYRVVEAASGDAALSLMNSGPDIDVVFTDIVMPGSLNGVDMALELRRIRPSLPVVFATGYSDRKVLDRWPGTADVLVKPYSIDDVARSIEAARVSALA